eukprot:363265-Chlamydomonas_euryale.AAC.1
MTPTCLSDPTRSPTNLHTFPSHPTPPPHSAASTLQVDLEHREVIAVDAMGICSIFSTKTGELFATKQARLSAREGREGGGFKGAEGAAGSDGQAEFFCDDGRRRGQAELCCVAVVAWQWLRGSGCVVVGVAAGQIASLFWHQWWVTQVRFGVRVSGSGPAKGMPVWSERKRAQPQAARSTANVTAEQAREGASSSDNFLECIFR